MDPETAHGLSLKAIRMGLTPRPGPITDPCLKTEIAGISLANPIGLAAGFDKNAEAIAALGRTGFGFIEVGSATPLPQEGNPRPRLFRLSRDKAAINRFGFNNQGIEPIARRLSEVRASVPVGLNLGANKTSPDRTRDYAQVLTRAAPHVAFATVNISSPNTEALRDLQGKAALTALLATVTEAQAGLAKSLPIFLKIAPDLERSEIEDIAEVALAAGIDGIIATNTTLSRDGLVSEHRDQMGGLSGQPLFEKSTRVLAQLYQMFDGRVALIGVGGIGSPGQAYEKIRAGANAVQLYSALAYQGMSLITEITRGLDHLLKRDGFKSVADAVGTGSKDWAA